MGNQNNINWVIGDLGVNFSEVTENSVVYYSPHYISGLYKYTVNSLMFVGINVCSWLRSCKLSRYSHELCLRVFI